MRLEHLLSGEKLKSKRFFRLYCLVCLYNIQEKDEAESKLDKVELSPIAQLVRALH